MTTHAACGTYAGSQRHLREGTPMCRPCQDARAAYRVEYRAQHPDVRARERRNNLARARALTRLAQRYPQEYEALRLEELRADPVDSPGVRP